MPRPPHRISESAARLHRALPLRFGVEDLIDVAERTGVNVFDAYEDLKGLIAAGWVTQQDDSFEKQPPLTKERPASGGDRTPRERA